MAFHLTRDVASSQKIVLLADDEPSVRLLVERILNAAGYLVIPTGNGAEATACAEGYSGEIDVLVSDIVMPGLNGVELAREVQKSRPATKVLLISGYFPEGLEFMAGWKFLRKPFSAGVLTQALENLLSAI
jgi:DNA-binding NtrC family response regulator